MGISDFITIRRKEPALQPEGLRGGDYLFSDCRLMLQHVMDNGLLPSEALRRKISIVDRRLAQAGLPTISGLSQQLILTEDELVKVTAPPTPPVMPEQNPEPKSPSTSEMPPPVDPVASLGAVTPSSIDSVPPRPLLGPLQSRAEGDTPPNGARNLEEPDPKSVSKQDFIEVALEVHSSLSALVAPATPTSLRATDPGRQVHSTTGMPHFLYGIMWLSFISAFLFLLTLPTRKAVEEKAEELKEIQKNAKKNEAGTAAKKEQPESQPAASSTTHKPD